MILHGAFVIAFVSFSLRLSGNVLLAFLIIVPMALVHCLCASDVEIGVVDLRA